MEDDDEVNGTSALSDRQAAALALAKKYCSEQTEAFVSDVFYVVASPLW